MNKFIWLIGLPIGVAIISAIATFINQKQTVSQARASAAQPSTVVTTATADRATGGDRLAYPPLRQTFTSGIYRLVISAEDDWKTPLTQAKLFNGDTVLWEQALPHQYGPRFVLISPQGNVLLLDEFINVASPHAITLINTKGQVIAQHSFKNIQTTLNRSTADLTKQATTGWWISAAPTLIELENCAIVRTGGTTLAIDLETGSHRASRSVHHLGRTL